MMKEKRSFLDRFTNEQDDHNSNDNYNSNRYDASNDQDAEYDMSPQMSQGNYPQENNMPMQVYGGDEPTQMSVSQSPQPSTQAAWETDTDNADAEGQLTIDVYQTDTEIVIKSTIAGVKPENLDVGISNDMITIKGERESEAEVSDENYYYQECYWGSFSRSVVLPTDVLADKIDATLKNGILTIRLPKADTTKTKKIQVRGF